MPLDFDITPLQGKITIVEHPSGIGIYKGNIREYIVPCAHGEELRVFRFLSEGELDTDLCIDKNTLMFETRNAFVSGECHREYRYGNLVSWCHSHGEGTNEYWEDAESDEALASTLVKKFKRQWASVVGFAQHLDENDESEASSSSSDED